MMRTEGASPEKQCYNVLNKKELMKSNKEDADGNFRNQLKIKWLIHL